jgi:hypothetical protein
MYFWIAFTSAIVVAGGMRFFSRRLRLNLLVGVTLATAGSLAAYGIPAGGAVFSELLFYIPLHASAISLLDYLRRKFALTDHSDWNF